MFGKLYKELTYQPTRFAKRAGLLGVQAVTPLKQGCAHWRLRGRFGNWRVTRTGSAVFGIAAVRTWAGRRRRVINFILIV